MEKTESVNESEQERERGECVYKVNLKRYFDRSHKKMIGVMLQLELENVRLSILC